MTISITNTILVAASSWVSRVVVVLAQFASIKILLNELGVADYAGYVIAMSIGGWVLLFDFGFGAALQNRISERRALNQPYNDAISFTFCISAFGLFAFMVIGAAFSGWLGPIFLGGGGGGSEAALADRFEIILILFGFSVLGGISYKVYFAEHKGYFANLFPAIAALIGLLFVLIFLPDCSGDKVTFALFIYNVPSAAIAIAVFLRLLTNRWSNPVFDMSLFQMASRFWIVAIMSAITLNLDYLIIGKRLSSGDVVVYQLVTKIFGLLYFVFSAVLSAVWPVFSEMLISGKGKEVAIIINRYVCTAVLITSFFTLCFCFFRKNISDYYFPVHDAVELEVPFIVLVGAYNVVLLVISVYSVALQSANITKVFIVWTPVQAILSVFGQWFLSGYFGIYGIIMGLLVSYLLVPFWLIPYSFKNLISEKSGSNGKGIDCDPKL